MAINKTFVPHTELKAQDLNDLVTQTNGYVAETKTELNGNIATAKTEVMTEVNKKPNILELSTFDHSLPLPLDATYYYGGLPTHSVTGTAYDSGSEVYTDYIGICINHEDDSGFEPQHHDVMVFVKSSSNYIYSETFNTSEASGYLEEHVARALGSVNATPSYSGLMSADDKGMFDDMVTEVFPLTVGVVSSNAGTRETGSSITPSIVLSVTRKGVNIGITSDMVSVSPNDGSLNAATKTYTGAAISSGSKTYQIAVTQGGQTRSIPNQIFKFLPYVYGGELSGKPANANAVKTQLESWGSSHGVLSDKTDSTAIYSTGVVPLSANNYYLFAVKGSVNLVCRHAGTDAVVTGCTTGTATIQRVKNSGSDSYSYIIVEKSASAWSFKITNS